jgi:adenosylcobinamide-phosphate synthase
MELIATFIPSLILLSLLLDNFFPDPVFKFHPIRIIGNIVSFLEIQFFKMNFNKKFLGLVFLVVIIFTTQFLFIGLLFLILKINFYIAIIYYIGLTYLFLSTKTLINEGWKVYLFLENKDIDGARKISQGLVSRNMEKEKEQGIVRATIESMTENMSDGVVAPILFLIMFGLPGLIFYKTVNTLDSMIGYKNNKYKDFGYFSAKFDDILNYVPARITGGLILFLSIFYGDNIKKGITSWYKDAQKGESPNGGIPISTFAGVTDVVLGGDVYDKENNIIKVPKVGGTKKPAINIIVKNINYISGSVLVIVSVYFIILIIFFF